MAAVAAVLLRVPANAIPTSRRTRYSATTHSRPLVYAALAHVPVPAPMVPDAAEAGSGWVYPFASMPPTPVFPSGQTMAQSLAAYGRMLQHVQSKGAAAGPADGAATVCGDSLAAAGATVLERVHLGLLALLSHPMHGVTGGEAWRRKEAEVEWCVEELERDVERLRSAHADAPAITTLALTTLHAFRAASLLRSL